MFTFIEGLPADVLAVEASGKITHEDYHDRLVPKAEAMMGKGPIKALYIIRDDASEFSPEAFWDDQMFGIKHWHDFSHVAIVTDLAWLRMASAMFAPLFPAHVKIFRMAELPAAKAWITAPT